MNKERKHIVFLARWYTHRYDPMFGLFVQRHAEAAALFNDITVVYCQQTTDNRQQTLSIRIQNTDRQLSILNFQFARRHRGDVFTHFFS
jgi:hypothetical protein